MRLYETTFLVNPQTDDVTIDRQVNDVIDIIKSNGGKLIHEDRMGTRRMAYPILGLNQAYYTSLLFESEVKALAPLDRHYRLGEAYLRSLTTLFDGDVDAVTGANQESEAPAVAPRPAAAPVPDKPAATSGPVGRRESTTTDAPAEAAPETPAATESADATPEAPAETVAEAPVEEPAATEAVTEEPEKKASEPTGDATGDTPDASNEEADEL